MDPKEAADAARNYITVALPGLDPAQLRLEEVAKCGWRKWRVTLSFTPPWYQQAQQGTNPPRIYKDIIIKGAGKGAGSVISMTDCTPCAPKSAQPSCVAPASMSWWGGARTLWRAIFVYASAAAGLASLIVLYIKVGWGDSSSLSLGEIVIIMAALAGMFIGFFAEGLRCQRRSRQRCGNKKKKRCSC